jgi:hypothetical protein
MDRVVRLGWVTLKERDITNSESALCHALPGTSSAQSPKRQDLVLVSFYRRN